MDLSSVNIAAELELMGVKFEVVGNEYKCLCPAHQEKTPSCSINAVRKVWKCQACSAKGDFVDFVAAKRGISKERAVEELERRYDLEEVKTVDPEVIERWHQDIWSQEHLLEQLHKRGITNEAIRKYRFGSTEGRISIPITDRMGRFVNVKKYLPGAPKDVPKFKNLVGWGKVRLWPHDQLKFSKIIINGGECKTVAVADRMNQFGFGAVNMTGGEGNWDSRLNYLLEGKEIWVCMDIDKTGVDATHEVCRQFKGSRPVYLPLDIKDYPHGDVNDYFGAEERVAEDFLALLDLATPYENTSNEGSEQEPVMAVHLSDATRPRFANKSIKTLAVVTAVSDTSYLVPRAVKCMCSRDEKYCSVCSIFAEENGVLKSIPADSPAIIDMVNSRASSHRESLREYFKIPRCKSVTFEATEHHKVEDVRLTPQLAMSSRSSDRVMQQAMHVGHGMEMNVNYEIEAKVLPHPHDQRAVLLIKSAKPTSDALESFAPPEDDMQALNVFQPKEWTTESIAEKLNEIYTDFEANVSWIFCRHELHLAVDLTYHSPLVLSLDGREFKGWVETLVIGDSAQGKTETSSRLMEHYGLGEKVVCKTATVAGLLGGTQPIAGKWFVTWGSIPMHDRRLCILEELKGASTEVLSKLTDMRSSGIAEIQKIEKRRTHARTRLLALSNARGDKPIAEYNYGVDAIRELIGSLEDIRRFDLCIAVSAGQVPPNIISERQKNRPNIDHVFSSELCRRLVLWGWTRHADEVIFEATDVLGRRTEELVNTFSDAIPLVDRGSMRFKLARLAAALAVRTFSRQGSRCIVRDCHVNYIADFILRVYSDRAIGYKEFSDAEKSANTISRPDIIRKQILAIPFVVDFIESMLYTPKIQLADICDWSNKDRGEGIRLLSLLHRSHCLRREDRYYVKTAPFLAMLKELRTSKEVEVLNAPDYAKEEM